MTIVEGLYGCNNMGENSRVGEIRKGGREGEGRNPYTYKVTSWKIILKILEIKKYIFRLKHGKVGI